MRPNLAQNSLSKKDNRTYICSDCGRKERVIDAPLKYPVQVITSGRNTIPNKVLKALSRLPKKVQFYLYNKRALIVCMGEEYGVTQFIDIPKINKLPIIVLSQKLATMPEDVAIGIVAHEIAHAYIRDYGGYSDANEISADLLANEWGFGKEIKKFHRRYNKESANKVI